MDRGLDRETTKKPLVIFNTICLFFSSAFGKKRLQCDALKPLKENVEMILGQVNQKKNFFLSRVGDKQKKQPIEWIKRQFVWKMAHI